MSPKTSEPGATSCSAIDPRSRFQRPQHRHASVVEVDHARLAALGVALDDLGALARARTMPADRRTLTVPASRSTSRQRSASASPRRIPVMASVCHSA